MKTKFFSLFLALVTSVGIVSAEIIEEVKIGNLYYDLDTDNMTAEVTYSEEDDYYGLTSVNIPSSVTCEGKTYDVTSIGVWAFHGCDNLTSIEIPNSVTSIGDEAFKYCNSLTSFEIPNSVTSIGDHTFAECFSLTSITIPNSVVSIGDYAFSWCSLNSVSVGTGVEIVGLDIFYRCYINHIEWHAKNCKPKVKSPLQDMKSLTSLVIGDEVDSIPYAFCKNCNNLTSLTFGNNIIYIGDGAFESCDSLTNIEIPNSVTKIGDYAFYDCYNLTTVTCLATTPPTLLGEDAFRMQFGRVDTLYVPAESIELYQELHQEDTGWKYFYNILPIGSVETAIDNTELPNSNNSENKIVRDGQLLILRDGKTYTVQGIEVQ